VVLKNLLIGELMKKICKSFLCVLFFLVIWNGCSNSTDTQLRIKNEKLTKVNMDIHTSLGNKYSINDIEAGQITSYQTISEGNITAINVSQNESVSFIAAKNAHYTIVLSLDKPPSIHID
jgi:hypothetical protein